MGCGASQQAVVGQIGPTEQASRVELKPEPANVPSSAGAEQLFISYRKVECGGVHGDDSAPRLKGLLEGKGWSVFLDQDGLEGGDEWADVLQRNIAGCEVLVALLSAGYTDSIWCMRELAMAMDKRKKIMPLWHSGKAYPPEKLELRLQGVQSIPSGRPFSKTELEDVAARIDASLRSKGLVPKASKPESLEASRPLPAAAQATDDQEESHLQYDEYDSVPGAVDAITAGRTCAAKASLHPSPPDEDEMRYGYDPLRNYDGFSDARALADALYDNTSLLQLSVEGRRDLAEYQFWFAQRGGNPKLFFGDQGTSRLAEALKHNSTLKVLQLHACGVHSKGMGALLGAIKCNTILQELHVSFSPITREEGKCPIMGEEGESNHESYALVESLKANLPLRTLSLEACAMKPGYQKAIAEALWSNTCLVRLHMRSNGVDDEAAAAYAEALQVNTTLKLLDLTNRSTIHRFQGGKLIRIAQTIVPGGGCKITEQGARALASALKTNTSLRALHLNDNAIGTAGAAALAEALQMGAHVRELNLSYNALGDEGAAELAKGLAATKMLQKLDLTNNSIKEAGAKALATAVASNTSLLELAVTYNSIEGDGKRALAAAMTEARKQGSRLRLVL